MSQYFDKALIEKYRMNGPRYTSYPTAVQFTPEYDQHAYLTALQASNQKKRDLSFYFHIPFCESVCYYCGCNKIITRNHKQSSEYLRYLNQDIERQTQYIDKDRQIIQLHLGGGTPTFLNADEMAQLIAHLQQLYVFAPQTEGEYSIEIDPRTVDRLYIKRLREMGFNRVSFGVQDIDPKVQVAVNRVQPLADIRAMTEAVREENFHSLSIDLIYGLPHQSATSFAKTIDAIIALDPDRLAIFHYAHMPHLFGAQKQMQEQHLPSSEEKLRMLETTITQLTSAGYEFIGLDHFAKPQDSLVQHQKNGTLYRNFQGYSTHSQCDLIGFGISAISMLENYYSQHHKARSKYYQALDAGELPVLRGVALSRDDHIRQKAINEIMCNLRLDFNALSRQFNIDATSYFSEERESLKPLASDGLIKIEQDVISVEPIGRLLIRNIAMIFDAYLKPTDTKKYSQVL